MIAARSQILSLINQRKRTDTRFMCFSRVDNPSISLIKNQRPILIASYDQILIDPQTTQNNIWRGSFERMSERKR